MLGTTIYSKSVCRRVAATALGHELGPNGANVVREVDKRISLNLESRITNHASRVRIEDNFRYPIR